METRDYILFDRNTQAIMYGYQVNAIQRMLDFDYVCQRKRPSVAAIVNPTRAGMHKCFWGTEEMFVPMYQSLIEASAAHSNAEVLINFASYRSAFEVSSEAVNTESIKTVAVIAEGIPERDARILAKIARDHGKWVIGPATVGGIAAGAFKIGNTGGSLQNIIESKLYRPGSVAYVSKSGGMSNEINNIISRNSDGVYEGIAIGGDRYPGTTFMDHIMRYQANPDVKIIVLLGEVGGTDEYDVIAALNEGRVTKPLVAWTIGSCARFFPAETQFGHAGARAGSERESAPAKNESFRDAGALVPGTFNEFDAVIREIFEELLGRGEIPQREEPQPPPIPLDFQQALHQKTVRKARHIVSTISDERGDELRYCGVPISQVVAQNFGIGGTLGLLWFKRHLPQWASEFLEMCLMITADHGPAVSGAHNAIVAARADKDLVSALTSGILTIGPRFGGAINDAASIFSKYHDEGRSPESLVKDMKAQSRNIPGIGHRIKSVTNPDKRVQVLVNYARENFPSTSYLNFAFEVERLTTRKRNNLILNVDGCIGVLCSDLLREIGFTPQEIRQFINLEALNAIFILGRSIGIVGHILDQRRLKQNLYRHPYDDILYLMPDEPDGCAVQ